jgi:uncharacterized protein YkwD
MSRRLLLLALATLASALIAAAVSGVVSADAPFGPYGRAMLHSLNRVRAAHHLPRLTFDRRMARTATGHSRSMVYGGYFAHGAWNQRVSRASGHARSVGEVLGWLGPASPGAEAARLVRAWLHSPEHRRVLLDGQLRRVGIGRVRGGAAMYTVDLASGR